MGSSRVSPSRCTAVGLREAGREGTALCAVTGVLSLSGARGRKQSPSTKRALLPQRKRSRFCLYQEPEEGAGAVK